MSNRNEEIRRFVEYVGGPTKAGEVLGCSASMINKMERGVRGFSPEHVRTMYHTKGFRLSFKRLFDL